MNHEGRRQPYTFGLQSVHNHLQLRRPATIECGLSNPSPLCDGFKAEARVSAKAILIHSHPIGILVKAQKKVVGMVL